MKLQKKGDLRESKNHRELIILHIVNYERLETVVDARLRDHQAGLAPTKLLVFASSLCMDYADNEKSLERIDRETIRMLHYGIPQFIYLIRSTHE